jgi:autotransporter-associated beta strand protein
MKNTIRTLKLLILFCCSLATTAAFGQVLTWTNLIATSLPGGNYGRGTNWSGDNGSGASTPISGTVGTFDGTVPGNLFIYSADGIEGAGGGNPIGGSFGANGTSVHLTPTQVGSVTFYPTNVSVGMGFDGIHVDAGAGQLIWGDNTANQLIATFRPSSGIHTWENESSHPIIFYPNFQIQNGGGTAHEILFTGTGDFGITNNLRNNNNAPVNTIEWDSTGTTTWFPGGVNDKFNDGGLGNVIITAGTVLVKGSGLLAISAGNTLTHNGTLLVLDSGAAAADTLNRNILGAGPIQVKSGTWTLGGASTWTGNLSLLGGEVVANGVENVGTGGPLGFGGIISFTGGTLGYGPNNNFDYSPRFDTATGQSYRFDTAGQNVTFTNAIGGAGNTVTKVGPGTLTLNGSSTYTGVSTVNGGRLVFQGPKSGTADIIVANGGALGVTATNAQVTPNTLTVTNSTLEFNRVSSTTTPLIAAGTITGEGQININVNSGTFVVGQSYPLFSWTSGTAPDINLGFLSGALGTLTTNGNTIKLNISALADNWNGDVDGNWTTPLNWLSGGAHATYVDPTPVVFDDSAIGATSVSVDALVQPKSVILNNSTLSYTITSTTGKDIGGTANLTKNGTGTLTLSGGANAYTGPTTINAGIVSVGALANGGAVSDIGSSGNSATNLVFNGGTLQYVGALQDIDRAFTVAAGGGTIDASGTGALSLSKTGAIGLSGPGARVFTLTGTSTDTNTLAATLGDQGGSSALAKTGTGTWILTGNNGYSGVTTIGNGTLQIGVGGATGSIGTGGVINNGSLHVNRTGTATIGGVISGGGSVNNDGTGTLVLANNSTYTGGTTVNAGTLQIGNGGASGSLSPSSPIVNNGKLVFNTTGTFSYTANGLISGTGNVVVTSSGLIKAIGNNTYTGWTLIDTNATFQPAEGNQGAFASSVVTNYGTFKLVRQDQAVFGYSNNIVGSGKLLKDVNNNNDNDVTLTGTNTYTGGTIIAGGGIVLGDGITTNAGSIVGDVTFTNSPTSQDDRRYLEFNRPDSFTFPGNITGPGGAATGNAGQVVQLGTGILTLTGTNTYRGGTIVSNGVIQVGSGGATGAIGAGNVTIGGSAGTLIFNRSDAALTVAGVITGDGSIVQLGTGTTTLSASNTLTGSTTISNGTLVVNSSVNGNLNINGGTLVAGVAGTAGALHVGGSLNLNSGTLSVALNKSLAASNTIVTVDTGSINVTGGTLKVVNVGPSLKVGDKFAFFNFPVTGGAGVTLVTPGFTASNQLDVDGSITVTSVTQVVAPVVSKPTLVNGTNVVISATGSASGTWALLSTNNLTAPLATWPVIQTGSFDSNGAISITNAIKTNQQYFILRVP